MAGNIYGGNFHNVSTIFAKSHEKSLRLWTKNLSLARGLLALQIKIPLGIRFLGPWEGGKQFDFCFLITLTSPPGHPTVHVKEQVATRHPVEVWHAIRRSNPSTIRFTRVASERSRSDQKKNHSTLLPPTTLVNESPKEFWFGVLEDLPLDLCFWGICFDFFFWSLRLLLLATLVYGSAAQQLLPGP